MDRQCLVTDRLFLQRRAPAAEASRRTTEQLQVQPPQQRSGFLHPSKHCSNWTFLLCSGCSCASHGCWPKPWWGPWICPRATLPVTVTAQAMQVQCVQKGTNRFQTTVPSNTERSPSRSQNHSFLGSEPKWAQPGEHSYPSTPICCSAKQSLHKASSFRIPD